MVSLGRVFFVALLAFGLLVGFAIAANPTPTPTPIPANVNPVSPPGQTYFCLSPFGNGVFVTQRTPCTPDCIFGETTVNRVRSDLVKAIPASEDLEVIEYIRTNLPNTFRSMSDRKAIIYQNNVPVFSGTLSVADEGTILNAHAKVTGQTVGVDPSGPIRWGSVPFIVRDALDRNVPGRLVGLSSIVDTINYGHRSFTFAQSEPWSTLKYIYEQQQLDTARVIAKLKVTAACKCGRSDYVNSKKTTSGICCITQTPSGGYDAQAVPGSNCKLATGGDVYVPTSTANSRIHSVWFKFKVPKSIGGSASATPGAPTPNKPLVTLKENPAGCFELGDQKVGSKLIPFYSAAGTDGEMNVEVEYVPSKCKSLDLSKQTATLEVAFPLRPDLKYILPVKAMTSVFVLFKVADATAAQKLDELLRKQNYKYSYALTTDASINDANFKSKIAAAKLFPDYPADAVIRAPDIGTAGFLRALSSVGLKGNLK